MMYVISDTHFNHKNIIQYENRPFADVEEMNKTMIARWNSVVKPEDTVIHLGDVGLGSEASLKEIIPQLNGTKILIKGNHDRKSNHFFLCCGFSAVYHTMVINYQGKVIFFSHCPESRRGDGNKYDIHLFGHVHSKGFLEDVYRNGACMCVERWNYYPISLDAILNICAAADSINPNI